MDAVAVDSSPPETTGAVLAENITPSSALIRWSKAGDNVTLDGSLVYRVYTSTSSPLDSLQAVKSLGNLVDGKTVGGTSLTLTGLNHLQRYHAAVVVSDDAGNEALAGTVHFDTTSPDTSSPSVVSVTGMDGAYKAGSIVDIDVNFSEPISLVGNSLSLTLTGGTRTAGFVSKPDGDTLRFRYVVQAGDNVPDLTVVRINLDTG